MEELDNVIDVAIIESSRIEIERDEWAQNEFGRADLGEPL